MNPRTLADVLLYHTNPKRQTLNGVFW